MAQLEEVCSFTGLTDTVRASLFTPDGSLFAGCADLTGRNVITCEETHKYGEHKGSIYSLALVEDLVYSGSADTTLKVWDLRAPKSVHTYSGHTNTVRCITHAVLNGKLHIITGSYDGTVKFWNVLSRGEGVVIKYDIGLLKQTEVTRFKGHSEAVTSIHLYEESIVTSSVDSTVKVWKEKGTEYGYLQTLQTESSTAASIIVPEVHSLFTCGATIKVWGTEGWYNSFTENSHKQPIRSLAAVVGVGAENFLASGSQDKSQKVWRIVSYE